MRFLLFCVFHGFVMWQKRAIFCIGSRAYLSGVLSSGLV